MSIAQTALGIAPSDHRISLLLFAAALILSGLIFILRMTICLVTKFVLPSPERFVFTFLF